MAKSLQHGSWRTVPSQQAPQIRDQGRTDFVQFQMDKEGKLNVLRLSPDDGQAYEFRRE